MLFSFHLHMTPLQMMGPPPPYLHTRSDQVDKGLGMIVPHKPIFPISNTTLKITAQPLY